MQNGPRDTAAYAMQCLACSLVSAYLFKCVLMQNGPRNTAAYAMWCLACLLVSAHLFYCVPAQNGPRDTTAASGLHHPALTCAHPRLHVPVCTCCESDVSVYLCICLISWCCPALPAVSTQHWPPPLICARPHSSGMQATTYSAKLMTALACKQPHCQTHDG